MSKKDVIKNFNYIANKLGLKYNDLNLYLTAFTHTSYANEHKTTNNERLEFLGDAILDFLVGEYLYNNYTDMVEGKLTKFRAQYVCQDANCSYAKAIGLDKCLLLGKGEKEQGGLTKPSILGDLFEAFLGAVYLDLGFEMARHILEIVVFPNIKYEDHDYKSRLQEYIQAESRKGVDYILEDETGPNHDKCFVFSVFHDGIKLGTGTGKNKKEAEQNAAKDALSKLVK